MPASRSLPEGAKSLQAKPGRRGPALLVNLFLALVSIGFGMGLLEVGSRIYYAAARLRAAPAPATEPSTPLHMLCDCPFLYRLNPDHPDISSQGLRDRDYAIPKPPGVKRILVLGDSITYGVGVHSQSTFPKLLEQQLRSVEVINSGVQGYTAFNELQYFLHEGIQFQADLVLVAFSPNDIVNPRRHINYAPEAIEAIPDEAIPNLDYDREHVLPTLEARQIDSPLENFAVYQVLENKLGWDSDDTYAYEMDEGYAFVNGEKWPTFVTAEDSLSIQVLTDYQSPEWQWLRGVYDQLQTAVEGSGARLVIVILPLAYQLDEEYPFLPQVQMQRYCSERAIDCLDLLPAFRDHSSEKPFLDASEGYYDIWHFTERGHELAAAELAKLLNATGFASPKTP